MPTYVYRFVETGETIEIQQDFSDDSLTEAVHPVDGTVRPVKKVFLPVGITFKGGGFYKTDSKGSSSAGTATSSADGSSSKGSSGGSDSASSSPSGAGSSTPSTSSSD